MTTKDELRAALAAHDQALADAVTEAVAQHYAQAGAEAVAPEIAQRYAQAGFDAAVRHYVGLGLLTLPEGEIVP